MSSNSLVYNFLVDATYKEACITDKKYCTCKANGSSDLMPLLHLFQAVDGRLPGRLEREPRDVRVPCGPTEEQRGQRR